MYKIAAIITMPMTAAIATLITSEKNVPPVVVAFTVSLVTVSVVVSVVTAVVVVSLVVAEVVVDEVEVVVVVVRGRVVKLRMFPEAEPASLWAVTWKE